LKLTNHKRSTLFSTAIDVDAIHILVPNQIATGSKAPGSLYKRIRPDLPTIPEQEVISFESHLHDLQLMWNDLVNVLMIPHNNGKS
jgi:hypothetical protein